MRKLLEFFIRDGRTTNLGGMVAQLLALAAIVAVIGFRLNNLLGWIILIVSGIVILVFGIAGRAEALGLKPFTNDPLGWRKAKETYQNDEVPAKKPGLIARLLGRK